MGQRMICAWDVLILRHKAKGAEFGVADLRLFTAVLTPNKRTNEASESVTKSVAVFEE